MKEIKEITVNEIYKAIQKSNGDLAVINFLIGKLKKIDKNIKSDLIGQYVTSQEKVFIFPDGENYLLYVAKMNHDLNNKVDSLFLCFTNTEPHLNKTPFSLISAYKTNGKILEFNY